MTDTPDTNTPERKSTDIHNEELWQFPMQYPIKIIGHASPELLGAVSDLLKQHFPLLDLAHLTVTQSSGGKYHSIAAVLPFENKEQVNAVYADLAASKHVKTAL
jgi:putative lipoic acid-binding regulatory protein